MPTEAAPAGGRGDALHVLVVEDNEAVALNLAEALEQRGHVADFATDGRQGLELALGHEYDVIVLDLALPGLDGLEVCARLRSAAVRHVPVLMLTARDTLRDKLLGFEKGADDYLTKPFALDELLARCEVLARRHLLYLDPVLRIGELVIDRRRRTVARAGRAVDLHPIAYRILLLLAESHPRVLTRSELTQRLWGDEPPESDALRSHLYRLRLALDRPHANPMLVTVHGVGYRLDPDAT